MEWYVYMRDGIWKDFYMIGSMRVREEEVVEDGEEWKVMVKGDKLYLLRKEYFRDFRKLSEVPEKYRVWFEVSGIK